MRKWKVGSVTVEVWEEGDEPFGPCSIPGCTEPAIYRSSQAGSKRCVLHSEDNG